MAVADFTADHRAAILSNVLSALQSSEVSEEPFSHLYATDIFPEDFYWNLIDHLLCVENYSPIAPNKRLSDGTYTRTPYQLDSQGLDALTEPDRPLWRAVTDTLRET